jgi:hypothetical protein
MIDISEKYQNPREIDPIGTLIFEYVDALLSSERAKRDNALSEAREENAKAQEILGQIREYELSREDFEQRAIRKLEDIDGRRIRIGNDPYARVADKVSKRILASY